MQPVRSNQLSSEGAPAAAVATAIIHKGAPY